MKRRLCLSLPKRFKPYGGTNFTAALKLAEQSISGKTIQNRTRNLLSKVVSDLFFEGSSLDEKGEKQMDGNITRRIIMLTDGGHTGNCNPVEVSQRLKGAGVIIECIGIAGNRNDVDEPLLKQIASIDKNGKPRYYFVGDTSSLIRKYKTMANQIRPV